MIADATHIDSRARLVLPNGSAGGYPPARRAQRLLYRFAGLMVGAAMVSVAGTALAAHRITCPQALPPAATRPVDDAVEVVTFRTADGLRLHGWYLPHPAAREAVVIAHGLGMTCHELLDLAQALRERGRAILLFDFRAHGASEGRRSTIGYREADDVAAAVAYLSARPELVGRRIGVAGISMGAAAALLAAAREERIAAVVADSAFATLRDVVAAGVCARYRLPPFPVAPLIIRFGELLTRASSQDIRPIDVVGRLSPRPLLLVHSAGDPSIPVAHAHALYAAAGAPRELWIAPAADHAAAFLQARDEYVERLDRFFTAACSEQAALSAAAH